MLPRPAIGLAVPFLLALATACDSKDDAARTPVIAASAIAAPPPPAGPKTLAFAIDVTSKTSIDMPAPKEHLRANTTAAKGEIVIDPGDLAKTRGQVRVDLASLTTHTFDDDKQNRAQTEHAHNWLEAGDLVTPDVREANRWAIFTLQSVSGIATIELARIAASPQAADETRVVAAIVRGDFFLHGHQVAKEVPVEIVFHYPTGQATTASPSRVDIRTTTPLHVRLAEHDVKPRDSFGKLAQATLSLVSKVAETADVTLDLTASPAPASAAPAPPAPSASSAR